MNAINLRWMRSGCNDCALIGRNAFGVNGDSSVRGEESGTGLQQFYAVSLSLVACIFFTTRYATMQITTAIPVTRTRTGTVNTKDEGHTTYPPFI